MVTAAEPVTKLLYKKQVKLMGNQFEISAVATDAYWAETVIQAAIDEIKRIEQLLTTFRDDSETNLVNQNAGIKPVKVSLETFNIIERSLRISRATQGAFDISYGSVDKKLWNFDTTAASLPDKKTALKMVRLINYRNIILNRDNLTIYLKEKGMRIGFGGIGKGYAAEMAKKVMIQMGCDSGIVNASGDLAAWGYQPNGNPWTIGIINPNITNTAFSYMTVTNMAVATSGNYEKYILVDGKRYSHTISPKTGLPVTGIKSVTILAPNAEIADAMATPIMIMGIKAGLSMINQMNDIEAILIDDNDNIYASKNIHFTK
ncbi:MAG TPA: FAD:protein FMN transferase [Chitinophagaceae bacterium]|nr:FAD:protein FMN transferase [Chitinophagaceae bacterium]